MAKILLDFTSHQPSNVMTKIFPLTAFASMLMFSAFAQNCCYSPPTAIQVNSDGSHSLLVNIPNTTMYINTDRGGVSLLPCGVSVTHDPFPSAAHHASATTDLFPTDSNDDFIKSTGTKTSSPKQKKARVKKMPPWHK